MCVKEGPGKAVLQQGKVIHILTYMCLPSETQLTAKGRTDSRWQLGWSTLRDIYGAVEKPSISCSARPRRLSKNAIPKCRAKHTTNFNDFYSGQRKTRNHNNTREEGIPEKPSAIVKDARGEITPRPCWESHNGQELYLLAKSTTV